MKIFMLLSLNDKQLGCDVSTSSNLKVSFTNAHTPCLDVDPESFRSSLYPGMETVAFVIEGVR